MSGRQFWKSWRRCIWKNEGGIEYSPPSIDFHEKLKHRRMCEHILEVGKKPVWAHSSSNLGSMKTALKCGFVQDKINTVIRKNDSGG
jgi:hypothetical protein